MLLQQAIRAPRHSAFADDKGSGDTTFDDSTTVRSIRNQGKSFEAIRGTQSRFDGGATTDRSGLSTWRAESRPALAFCNVTQLHSLTQLVRWRWNKALRVRGLHSRFPS